MSSCHNCTIAHLKKWPTRCQQGVNKVSTRCQICNHLPMKNMQVILSVFCLSSENNLRICVCICNLFFGGRDEVQKKNDILEKWRGGENKMWVLIRDQSPPPPMVLSICSQPLGRTLKCPSIFYLDTTKAQVPRMSTISQRRHMHSPLTDADLRRVRICVRQS